MDTYIIKATCDPYNAGKHYNGEPVLKYKGTTPVEWIIVSGLESEKEAKDALMDLAKSCRDYGNGNWSYEDEESVANIAGMLKNDYPEDFTCDKTPDMSWFKGPGIYSTNGEPCPVLLKGGECFEDDTLKYSIEKLDAIQAVLAEIGSLNSCTCILKKRIDDTENDGALLLLDAMTQDGMTLEAATYVFHGNEAFVIDDWQGPRPESLEEISGYAWKALDGTPAVIMDGRPRKLA